MKISLSGNVTAVLISWTSVETSLTAISRVMEFRKNVIPEESGNFLAPPAGWGSEGSVEFRGLSATHKYVMPRSNSQHAF